MAMERCEPVTIAGDRHRLRQLLLNLSDNAVKYSLPGEVVSLEVQRLANHALLRISNTADPVPLEVQARLFDRFIRGPNAQVKATEGCGLGLSIAKWIVEAHGGTIALTSEPPNRIVVSVRLPLLRPAAPRLWAVDEKKQGLFHTIL